MCGVPRNNGFIILFTGGGGEMSEGSSGAERRCVCVCVCVCVCGEVTHLSTAELLSCWSAYQG